MPLLPQDSQGKPLITIKETKHVGMDMCVCVSKNLQQNEQQNEQEKKRFLERKGKRV